MLPHCELPRMHAACCTCGTVLGLWPHLRPLLRAQSASSGSAVPCHFGAQLPVTRGAAGAHSKHIRLDTADALDARGDAATCKAMLTWSWTWCLVAVQQPHNGQKPHQAQAVQAAIGVGGDQRLELGEGQRRRGAGGRRPTGAFGGPRREVVPEVQRQQRRQVAVRRQQPLQQSRNTCQQPRRRGVHSVTAAIMMLRTTPCP